MGNLRTKHIFGLKKCQRGAEILPEVIERTKMTLTKFNLSFLEKLLLPGADLGFSRGGANFLKIFETFDDFFLGRSD